MTDKIYKAIGLMSGTSCDGIDVALIETDGKNHVEAKSFMGIDYTPEQKQQIKACYGMSQDDDKGTVKAMEKLSTILHADAVKQFLELLDTPASEIDIIGFHGQTIFHDPDNRFTWQVGDGDLLAKETGIDVVYDFRSADITAGGQGAPLAPVYHRALASDFEKPLMILNIGGVANVTYIGKDGQLIAFDTGPGGALMDDYMHKHTDKPYDRDGETAKAGTINKDVLLQLLSHPYFAKEPPKSLDRDAFAGTFEKLNGLSVNDAMATLNAFTVSTIALSLRHVPEKPQTWLVGGGGRKNRFLMENLEKSVGGAVQPIDDTGWNGDAVEAEAFAYMAVRHLLNLPISFPKTTACPKEMTGGKLAKKPAG